MIHRESTAAPPPHASETTKLAGVIAAVSKSCRGPNSIKSHIATSRTDSSFAIEPTRLSSTANTIADHKIPKKAASETPGSHKCCHDGGGGSGFDPESSAVDAFGHDSTYGIHVKSNV